MVLFDRGKSGFEVCQTHDLYLYLFKKTNSLIPLIYKCNDIYFHLNRSGVTYRIYKLLDRQVKSLLDFILLDHHSKGTPCLLPILGDKENRDRVDLDDAIDCHGIFRDY